MAMQLLPRWHSEQKIKNATNKITEISITKEHPNLNPAKKL
jgi:hypothetical protein